MCVRKCDADVGDNNDICVGDDNDVGGDHADMSGECDTDVGGGKNIKIKPHPLTSSSNSTPTRNAVVHMLPWSELVCLL